MKTRHIINHLRRWLPTFTDAFTDELNVVSMTRLGANIAVTTVEDHNLAVGSYVTIFGAKNPIDISNLIAEESREIVRYGLQVNPGLKGQNMIDLGINIAIAETAQDHDLTEGYQEKILIENAANAAYNGEHYLLKVPNRRKFMYLLDSLPPTPDISSPKLLEDLKYGFEGFHKVDSIIDPKSYLYSTEFEAKLGNAAEGTITARVKPRITGAVTIDRAIESYTPQAVDKMYAFVILNDTSANKDRAINTDATASHGIGEDFRHLILNPFSIFIFVPSKTEIAGLNARDDMQDVLPALCKGLVAYTFPPDFLTQPYSGIIFTGHGFYAYTPVTYIHEFNFEAQEYMRLGDVFEEYINVAFRDISMTHKSYLNPDTGDIITGNFSLDDEIIL